MMPIFSVLGSSPSEASTRPNSSTAHATSAAVAELAVAEQIVFAGECRDEAIQNRLVDRLTVHRHRVGREVMPDVSNEHARAARQHEFGSVGCGVDAISVESTLHRLVTLLEGRDKITLHQAEPVAVDDDLVIGVDCAHGVFAVHDRRNCRLEINVGDASAVVLADVVSSIDADIGVEAVLSEQDIGWRCGVTGIASELATIGKHRGGLAERHLQCTADDGVARRVCVTAIGEGSERIEECSPPGDDLLPANRVVPIVRPGSALIGDDVRAVQRVVQRAPAGVRRIEGVAGVVEWNHQLRASGAGDLRVDLAGCDGDVGGSVFEVTDLTKKSQVVDVVVASPVCNEVGVDLVLQLVASGEKHCISRAHVDEYGLESGPEVSCGDTGAGRERRLDEVVERLSDLEGTDANHTGDVNDRLRRSRYCSV
jgi:hypothetical protein